MYLEGLIFNKIKKRGLIVTKVTQILKDKNRMFFLTSIL